MKGHHWIVWHTDDEDTNLCEGSHAKCLAYYRSHGGEKAELHIGYVIDEVSRWKIRKTKLSKGE